MVRRRSLLNKRTSTMSWEEAVYLTALGGKPRPADEAPGAPCRGRVSVPIVLCWWCREYHSPDEVQACMVLPRKSATADSCQLSTSNALVAGQWGQFPALWEFLTASVYPDGVSRKTGRLSVSFESGLIRLSLTDDETGQYASLNGRNLDDLFLNVELGLSENTLSWKASRYTSGRKQRS